MRCVVLCERRSRGVRAVWAERVFDSAVDSVRAPLRPAARPRRRRAIRAAGARGQLHPRLRPPLQIRSVRTRTRTTQRARLLVVKKVLLRPAIDGSARLFDAF